MQGFQARARSAPGGAVGRRAAYGNGDPVPMIGIGAGGHARCVIDAMRSLAGRYRLVGLFDDDPRLCGQSVEGIPVLGAFAADRSGADALGAGAAFVGVGGVGLTSARRQVFLQLDAAGFDLPAIVHRSAHVSPRAHLADAVQVLAGAIVNTGARLGENAIVNSGAIVGHDVSVGAHAHVASGAILGGGVVVESGAHVGSGATILEGRHVGKGAVVGSGAVVNRDVPPGVTVVGVPARVIPSENRSGRPPVRSLAAS